MRRHNYEAILQEHFCHWMDSKGLLFNASMAGVNLGITAAIRRKKMGAKAGFPDVAILEPNKKFHGLFIELKAGKNPRATPEQKQWQSELVRRGYQSLIMPGNMDFSVALAWLKNKVEEYLQ